MQGWLRWVNYIDPIVYAFEAIVANEFSGREFPCAQFVPVGPAYVNATAFERACAVAGVAPGGDAMGGDVYINLRFGYYHSHIWR